MRLRLALVALVLLLVGGWLAAAHLSGGALWHAGLPLGGDRARVRQLALSFWEDIQYKDFARAASYHRSDKQGTVDIPFLLERLFQMKPESLDFMAFEVVLAEVDSTSLRARVKTRVKLKTLLDGKVRDQEVMLYFRRPAQGQPWFMELESSLHELEPDASKKH